jgi:hypothetical protein
MNGTWNGEERPVILQIQNSKKPEQVIQLVMDTSNGHLETVGLKALFGMKEIRLETVEVLQSLPEYAQVLSFLLEAMSAAQDLNLPFVYQRAFDFNDEKYTIYDERDWTVLKRVDSEETLDRA